MIQVCIVTRDHRQVLDGLVRLGIGPWTIRTLDPSNCTQTTYHGRPAEFTVRVCLANSRNMNWEVVEPVSGPSIYADFLERHGEGVQHLAFNCDGLPYEDQLSAFAERGYEVAQSGLIAGRIRFSYLATEADARTIIEVYDFPPGAALSPVEAPGTGAAADSVIEPGLTIRFAAPSAAAAAAALLRDSIRRLCTADHGDDPDVAAAWCANKTPDHVARWIADPGHSCSSPSSTAGCSASPTAGKVLLNYVAPDARFSGAVAGSSVTVQLRGRPVEPEISASRPRTTGTGRPEVPLPGAAPPDPSPMPQTRGGASPTNSRLLG